MITNFAWPIFLVDLDYDPFEGMTGHGMTQFELVARGVCGR